MWSHLPRFYMKLRMPRGDKKLFKTHNSDKKRGIMKDLLRLTAVPPQERCPNKLAQLRELRETPLDGECVLIWCLQYEDDLTSRQPLPEWVSKPLETFVLHFADEKKKWDKLIAGRRSAGKNLTRQQQEKYRYFCEHCIEQKFLYDKVDRINVTKIRSNASTKMIAERMFSLQCKIGGDSRDKVTVTVANGVEHNLILLRGDPVVNEAIPAVIDAGVAPEVVDALNANQLERNNLDTLHDEELPDAEMLQEEHVLAEETGQAAEMAEILADSSDEEALQGVYPNQQFVRVKSFLHRPAFKNLFEKGLTMLPSHVPGIFLSFHKSSQVWQASYPGCSLQLNFTFGKTTGRILAA